MLIVFIFPHFFNQFPGQVKFTDPIEAAKAEVVKLQERGVNKIIILGTGSLSLSKTFAVRVPGVDVVIGGSTNTFLYNGKYNNQVRCGGGGVSNLRRPAYWGCFLKGEFWYINGWVFITKASKFYKLGVFLEKCCKKAIWGKFGAL